MHDSSFCCVHQTEKQYGPHDKLQNAMDPGVHPLLRLASPRDAFDVVREAINATRTGQLSPGQAYALASLLNLWCKLFAQLREYDRVGNLRTQMLGELTDADVADTAALEAAASSVQAHMNGSAPSTSKPASNGNGAHNPLPESWGNRVDLGAICKILAQELRVKSENTEQR